NSRIMTGRVRGDGIVVGGYKEENDLNDIRGGAYVDFGQTERVSRRPRRGLQTSSSSCRLHLTGNRSGRTHSRKGIGEDRDRQGRWSVGHGRVAGKIHDRF